MQPYFFPYLGYFQLMANVDEFVIYDNIQFSKKGWIHRNRILVNGKDSYISLPLKSDSDYLDIRERKLADSWDMEKHKMINRIKEAYRKAPQFENVFPIIKECLLYPDSNLFNFLFNALDKVKSFLFINTPLLVSSGIQADHGLKSTSRVIEICKNRNAQIYINPVGGISLYDKEEFKSHRVELQFLEMESREYAQLGDAFVPYLSIIDVMMFNTREKIRDYLASGFILK